MPRPANPGWYPKTMSLSAEVIEAVWVLAAKTGRSPGKVVNEILAAALLGEPHGAPVPGAPEPAAPGPGAPEPGAPEPPLAAAGSSPAMDAGPTPGEDPAVVLLAVVAQPWKTAFGTRIGFFQELSARCGEPVSHRALAEWQAQGRIPDAYVAHVQAMLAAGSGA